MLKTYVDIEPKWQFFAMMHCRMRDDKDIETKLTQVYSARQKDIEKRNICYLNKEITNTPTSCVQNTVCN